MTTGLGSAPTPAEGYGWRRPPDGRLAHLVPTGKNYTLCGLITSLTDEPWPIVLSADFANDVWWCLTCGDHMSAAQESLGASIWIAWRPEDLIAREVERRINGSRTPAEIRRTLAELDARMSTDRRGATPPSRAALSSRTSGRAVSRLAVAPRPPNERRLHDPFGTCVVCKAYRAEHRGTALTASGLPAGCPPHAWNEPPRRGRYG